MIIPPLLTTSLIHSSLKGWENALFELGSESVYRRPIGPIWISRNIPTQSSNRYNIWIDNMKRGSSEHARRSGQSWTKGLRLFSFRFVQFSGSRIDKKNFANPELALTLYIPRVIKFKFPLQPHQKYYITLQYEELAFHSLLRRKMIVLPILTTSPNTFLFKRLREYTFLTWEWKGKPP